MKTQNLPYLLISVFLIGINSHATNYFVSTSGNDTNTGTISQPFQTLQKAADIVQAGDTVFVRGGYYNQVGVDHSTRGLISLMMKTSGTIASPIVFMTYPGEKPVISGTEIISGWQPCPSDTFCGGNPNWQNIYYTNYNLGQDILSVGFLEKNSFPFVSMDPNPVDPFYWKIPGTWRSIPTPGYTDSTITDTSYLASTDAGHFEQSYVGVWSGNNNVFIQKIDSFNPSTHTIHFPSFNAPLNLNKDRYCIINHLSLIDRQGEYYYDTLNKRLFYWPYDPSNLDSNMLVTKQDRGIYFNNKSYIEVNGFEIKGYSGNALVNNLTGSSRSEGLRVINNKVSFIDGIGISLAEASNSIIKGNHVSFTGDHGIQFVGSASNGKVYYDTIADNYLTKIGRSGLRFSLCHTCLMENNTNENSTGQHANGISIYLFSTDIIVKGNKIKNCNIPLAISQSDTIDVTENIFVGGGGIYAWSGGDTLYHYNIYNNTIIKGSTYFGDSYQDINFYNNISYGLSYPSIFNHSNNLFLNLSWTQTYNLSTYNESLEMDSSKVFVDYVTGDYTLLPDSCGSPNVIPCSLGVSGFHVGALPCDINTDKMDLPLNKPTLNVFPNPSKGNNIHILISGYANQEVRIVIKDILGKEFFSQDFMLHTNEIVISLPANFYLAPGLYVLTATNTTNFTSKKIVVH